ncbi:MAG: glutamine-hydrolyzing carbamoyl-phosphate synthase small subunit [Acidobacteria bacterium]|nr:glutamine-hydrolyzing carbamoyl-phosphate synthase small subunit [Acidobacteriota bacterium]
MEAILALEDGTVFRGKSLGAVGDIAGEVVFNTGMSGYQEILTDPSYRAQLVVLTVPHVGNTGVNTEDPESDRIQAAALIVRDASAAASSWRADGDLAAYLRRHGVVGISGIDTRALTRRLRERGVMRGCLASNGLPAEAAVARARAARPIEELDLVAEVTCSRAGAWREGRGALLGQPGERPGDGLHVVAFDYGVKRNILRMLAGAGFRLTVVPAGTGAGDVLALRPDGVFLSNGPGDPAAYDSLIATIRALLGRLPTFGICLGHQMAALALGARTFKLKFGHRGINHPVRREGGGQVGITSQNHGYAVAEDGLPDGLEVTHRSLYDGTIEGLAHREIPFFSVQFHPEAAPGPHDSWELFGSFADLIRDGHPVHRARSA